MTLALGLLFAVHLDQASQLLDDAVAQPAETIRAQILTQGSFLADRYEFVDEFKMDTMGLKKANPSALAQLIARGADVVPYLVSQLGSKEPTKYSITNAVAYEFYDPKTRMPETEAWDVVTVDYANKAPLYDHVITRGDLAFFALGQIVNRWYGILHFDRWTLFCSASEHPEIQKQAMADWGDLTAEKLRASLRNDVVHPDSYARMVHGFSRFRNFASAAESVDLGVACLKQAYGRWPMNKPDPSPRTIFTEFQPIAHWKIDQVCQQMLDRTDKENNLMAEYDATRYHIVNYLRLRPNYMPICIKVATEEVKKKRDKYGYFARFLRFYGKKI